MNSNDELHASSHVEPEDVKKAEETDKNAKNEEIASTISDDPVLDFRERSAFDEKHLESEALEGGDEENDAQLETADDESIAATDALDPVVRVRRAKRQPKIDAVELRLLGRRALCKRVADIAPSMGKMVMERVLNTYLIAVGKTKGIEDEDLRQIIKKDTSKLTDRARIIKAVNAPDLDYNLGQIKAININILLQEETHCLTESNLTDKVIEFEKILVKKSKSFDLAEIRKQNAERWHQYDTYRIVLDAAWRNDDQISPDEAGLLAVLRTYLNITLEEHWTINALLKRFPKDKCALHTPDEINEARKDLQRQGLLLGYGDENSQRIDAIPEEIATVLRRDYAGIELQTVNFRRLMSHDSILLVEMREVLLKCGFDKSGNKAELIERIVACSIKPSDILINLALQRLFPDSR